jgi:exodeoxyribonuclease-3
LKRFSIIGFYGIQLVSKKGYSGVATLWPKKLHSSDSLVVKNYQIGLGLDKFDVEGRLVLTEFRSGSNHLFSLINAYYPQGGRGPHRIEYKIEFYKQVKELTKELKKTGQKVILCGDFNTTVTDIGFSQT